MHITRLIRKPTCILITHIHYVLAKVHKMIQLTLSYGILVNLVNMQNLHFPLFNSFVRIRLNLDIHYNLLCCICPSLAFYNPELNKQY